MFLKQFLFVLQVEDNPVSSSTISDPREGFAETASSPVDQDSCKSQNASTPQTSPDGSTITGSLPQHESSKGNENTIAKKVLKPTINRRMPAGPIQGGTVSTSNGLGRVTPQPDIMPSSVVPRPSSSQVFSMT